jgi:hypothetical protein
MCLFQHRSTNLARALFVLAPFTLMTSLWAADAESTLAPAVTVVKSKRSCFMDGLEATGVVVPAHEILVRPRREGLEIAQVLVHGSKGSRGWHHFFYVRKCRSCRNGHRRSTL